MFSSNVFDYVNVLDKVADASWTRNELIANNIANVDTPGYKRQDTNFVEEFKRALSREVYEDMDTKVARVNDNLDDLNARVYTDGTNVSYRVDGNNVDIDTENVMLAKNQLLYQGVMNAISQEFNNMQAAMRTSS